MTPQNGLPKPIAVTALDALVLSVKFSNGEERRFDLEPYLKYPAYQPLKNEALFRAAHIAHGTVVWNDDIDVSPANLYLLGEACATESRNEMLTGSL